MDMAYRATITPDLVEGLPEDARKMYRHQVARTWWGPDSHCVFYPIRNGAIWNLVLM